jgi:hypothetical protein
MPSLPLTRLAVGRLRFGSRSGWRELLLNGIEPITHPVHPGRRDSTRWPRPGPKAAEVSGSPTP